MTPEQVAALLAERGAWTWSRSSGPGGQRRDHAETRAVLTLTAADLHGMPDDLAARLAAAHAGAGAPAGADGGERAKVPAKST